MCVACSEEKAQDAIFYSYTKYINGFAATLEEEHATEISSMHVYFFAPWSSSLL
jgi:hypothetical protein